MLSHTARVAGPINRASTESLVVVFRGPSSVRVIQGAVTSALEAAQRIGQGLSGPGCEWLNPAGLADSSEAGLGYVLGRMGVVMRRPANAAPSPARALLHQFSDDCRLLVVTADAAGARCADLAQVFSRTAAGCAELTGSPGRAVRAEPLPAIGCTARLFENARQTERPRVQETVLPVLLTAIGVVLALTGTKLVAVDISLPGTAPSVSRRRIVPLVLTSRREPRLKELLTQAQLALARAGTQSDSMLHFHAGCVVAGEAHCLPAWQCGPLTVSGYRLSHFADWDMKVTLSSPEDWTVQVECALMPTAITQLLVHTFRCVLERPRTLLLNVPLV